MCRDSPMPYRAAAHFSATAADVSVLLANPVHSVTSSYRYEDAQTLRMCMVIGVCPKHTQCLVGCLCGWAHSGSILDGSVLRSRVNTHHICRSKACHRCRYVAHRPRSGITNSISLRYSAAKVAYDCELMHPHTVLCSTSCVLFLVSHKLQCKLLVACIALHALAVSCQCARRLCRTMPVQVAVNIHQYISDAHTRLCTAEVQHCRPVVACCGAHTDVQVMCRHRLYCVP